MLGKYGNFYIFYRLLLKQTFPRGDEGFPEDIFSFKISDVEKQTPEYIHLAKWNNISPT